MTNQTTSPAPSERSENSSSTQEPTPAVAQAAPMQQGVDELDNIDFLLEEIENKIAPLALA